MDKDTSWITSIERIMDEIREELRLIEEECESIRSIYSGDENGK